MGGRRKYAQVVQYPVLAAQPDLAHREDEFSQVNTGTEHEAQSADTVENHPQSPLSLVQSLTQEGVGQEQGDSSGDDDGGTVTAGQEKVVLGEEANDSG